MESEANMIRYGLAVLAGTLLAAAPAHAQSHQHGPQPASRPAAHSHQDGGHEHCAMHAEKHGTKHAADAADAAAPAGAAHAGHGASAAHAAHGAGDGQASHDMGAMHRYAPKMLVQHRDGLELTDTQVAALEALQAAHKADCERRKALVKAAEEAAATELAADSPDLDAYGSQLRAAAGHRVDCKVDMARMVAAAKALLTPEQASHLEHMDHAGH
jgi:Spy/CpxP family protein refolding chaperone